MQRHRRTTRGRTEDGAAVVEFALISIPLMVLLLGMIQYGWYFYVSQTTSGAASNVTRRLEVGDCWTGTAALDLARRESPQVSGLVKAPTTLAGAVPGETQIVVTVSADANIIGFLPLPNGGIVTRTVQAQLEDDASGVACP